MQTRRRISRWCTTTAAVWRWITRKRCAGPGWAKLGAEQGNAAAQIILGTLYENGHGVEQDFVSAYEWVGIAASSGNTAGAQAVLERIKRRLTAEEVAEAEARVRAWNRDRR